jgi:hypothetical protein
MVVLAAELVQHLLEAQEILHPLVPHKDKMVVMVVQLIQTQ